MSSFSIGGLFRQFLETRAPLLFLIGSLALGVLGNAFYELLTSTFGAMPEFLIGLVVSAIIVFAFVALGLRRVLRAIERGRAMGQPAPDRAPPPHAGLILAVGLSDPGPERGIIEWHARGGTLRHCWLIVTPQVRSQAADKLSDLRQLLQERNALPHPIEVDDALKVDQLFQTMGEVLREAAETRGAYPLIADITGGNKPMTVGLLLACLEADVAMQYWHVPRDERGRPLTTQQASAMQIILTTREQEEAGHASAAA